MTDKHYLNIKFGITKDKTPEIYDFLWDYLPSILEKLEDEEVRIEIERLEPLDAIYTNLSEDEDKIKKIFDEFCDSHHLKEKADLTSDHEKTSIKAKVEVKSLGQLIKDYNLLFDIFFTDLILKSDKLMVDMMNGFSNSVLLVGAKDVLEIAKDIIEKKAKEKIEFEYVDHHK